MRKLLRNSILPFVTFLLISFLYSCSGLSSSTTNDETINEITDSIKNTADGVLQELKDNTAIVYGDSTTKMASYTTSEIDQIEKALDDKGSITITYNNGLATSFEWDPDSESYIRTLNDVSITTDTSEGIMSTVEIQVWFYETDDATGTPVQLDPDKPRNLANNANIKSMRYKRTATGSFTNLINGAIRDVSITTDFTITGVNDGVDGIHIEGTRTGIKDVKRDNKVGHFEITHTLSVDAYKEKLDDNQYHTTFIGEETIVTDGTIVNNENGNTRTIHKEVTAEFTKERTVTITVDGQTVTIDIETGEILNQS